MVRLHVKRGDENLFLYDTELTEKASTVIHDINAIYNGRLKVNRICLEMEELANYGVMLPQEMQGLNDDQIQELKLSCGVYEKCIPSGGYIFNKDPMGRRNGQQPKENIKAVILNSIKDARNLIDKNLIKLNKPLTQKDVEEALRILRGACIIAYPMQLPPYDNIAMEFSNTEDLTGTQASKEVIDPTLAEIWFAGHQILPENKLGFHLGNSEKSKVIVKLARKGEGIPSSESVITEKIRTELMRDAYRRQNELKELELDDDDEYYNAQWSDSKSLKLQAHGLENTKFSFNN